MKLEPEISQKELNSVRESDAFNCDYCGRKNEFASNITYSLLVEIEELKQLIRENHPEHIYIGFVGARHFHRPDCEWIAQNPGAEVIEFFGHEAAVKAGRKPCKTCRA